MNIDQTYQIQVDTSIINHLELTFDDSTDLTNKKKETNTFV